MCSGNDAPICSFAAPKDTCLQLVIKSFVEFLGTFILVHAVCLSFNQMSSHASPALAAGFTLVFLVYTFGHVSGGHFNPAVSTGVWIGGGLDFVTWGLYIFAQFAGGIVGGVISAKVATDGPFPVYTSEGHDEGLWLEFLFTFALVTAFLNSSLTINGSYSENSFFGLAVGLVFVVALYLQTFTDVAPGFTVSSGALNPALFLGANIGSIVFGDRGFARVLDLNVEGKYWALFLFIEFLAAVVAGFFFVVTEQWIVAENKGYGSDTEETTEVVEKVIEPAGYGNQNYGNNAPAQNYGNNAPAQNYGNAQNVEMTY